jgi:hypothetical protein
MGYDEGKDATSVTTSTPHYQHLMTPHQQLLTHVSSLMTTICHLYPIRFSGHSLLSLLRMFILIYFYLLKPGLDPNWI